MQMKLIMIINIHQILVCSIFFSLTLNVTSLLNLASRFSEYQLNEDEEQYDVEEEEEEDKEEEAINNLQTVKRK
jgi:hypothetical protein